MNITSDQSPPNVPGSNQTKFEQDIDGLNQSTIYHFINDTNDNNANNRSKRAAIRKIWQA